MYTKAKALGFILFSVIMSVSCSLFGNYDGYVSSLEFKSGKYYVDVDDITVIYLSADPEDSFDYYSLDVECSDESIVKIVGMNKKQILVQGIKEGTVILNGKLGKATAMCAVSVKEKSSK